ncbi:hypothetical protein RGU70_08600 [Herbaspirillum sp. RTI4]|uniref:hypothetical protein n=1 Tax=Herbaspirillum sp. RTI4 TaxID=3048640 RepID=UPI002AB53B52|nr:hypothetical protein [Herbaspirillum sp. RTI4]MDY7578380.1 hypothetical protein [Herbaspirillum sp. RTI4]
MGQCGRASEAHAEPIKFLMDNLGSTNISRGILTLLNASMASVALNYRLLLPNATALTANVFFYCGLRDILQSVFKLNVFYGPAHARRPLSCVSLKSLTMIATAYLFNQLTVNAVMGEASPSGQSAGTLPDMPWENGLWRSAINTLGEAADAATYAMVPMLPTMMARWKSHYGTDIEQQLVTMPLPPLHQLHMTIRAGLPSLDSMINDTGSRLATRTSIFVNVVLASVLMGTAIQEASNEGYFNQTTADFLSNLAGATALVAQYHMFDHSLRFDPNNPATREIEMSNPGLSTSPSIVQLDTLGSLSLNEFQLYAEDEMMETNLDAFNKTASRNDDEKRHFRDAHEKKVALRRKSMVDLKRSAYENQVLSRSSSMSDQDFNE